MSRSVAVIGAGLSGLAAARSLLDSGASVTVFDKGRRPGGRANTREHGERRFDHGAQYFTVHGEVVASWLAEWREAGVVAKWAGDLVYIDGGGISPAQPATRYVGVPGMVDLALHMAQGVDVRSGIRIEALHRADGAWSLEAEDGEEWSGFDHVIVAVPAPQAAPLLAGSPALAAAARAVTMEPCWSAMLSFSEPLELGFDAAFVRTGQLSWVARDSSKPGRPPGEAWVVHFNGDWSRHHWQTEPDRVAELAEEALRHRFPSVPEATFSRAHRWGYALAPKAGEGILYDDASRLGACGDWCVGGRVEGALTSGLEIARRITRESADRVVPPGDPGPPS